MRAMYAEAEREFEGFIDYWRPIMALDTWHVRRRYHIRPATIEDAATCDASLEYETANIDLYIPRYLDTHDTLELRRELAVHELSHALAPSAGEVEVTRIARALLRAHDVGSGIRVDRFFK